MQGSGCQLSQRFDFQDQILLGRRTRMPTIAHNRGKFRLLLRHGNARGSPIGEVLRGGDEGLGLHKQKQRDEIVWAVVGALL